MKRQIHFEGTLKDMFGESMGVSADTFQEALRCVDVNRPGFREYLIESASKGIEFKVTAGPDTLSEDDLTSTITGDFYVTAIPSGSKTGGGKIVAALAILALIIINPGFAFSGGTGHSAVAITKLGTAAASLATNLALAGIQQILAPDPSVDADEPTSYLFNGAEQNILEGDPVPLLYGELRVPGTPVSFEVINRKFQRNNVMVDVDGNLVLAGV